MVNLSFYSQLETAQGYAFELGLRYRMNNFVTLGEFVLSRFTYNSSYSMLQVELDGNLEVNTYYEHVDWEAWDITFSLFGIEKGKSKSECKLPKKCGELGICEHNQCVACPRKKGLEGWSDGCAPPVLPSCINGGSINISDVGYFKITDVMHFLNWHKGGDGPMKLVERRKKCDKNCERLEFFYNNVSAMFLLALELGTFSKI